MNIIYYQKPSLTNDHQLQQTSSLTNWFTSLSSIINHHWAPLTSLLTNLLPLMLTSLLILNWLLTLTTIHLLLNQLTYHHFAHPKDLSASGLVRGSHKAFGITAPRQRNSQRWLQLTLQLAQGWAPNLGDKVPLRHHGQSMMLTFWLVMVSPSLFMLMTSSSYWWDLLSRQPVRKVIDDTIMAMKIWFRIPWQFQDHLNYTDCEHSTRVCTGWRWILQGDSWWPWIINHSAMCLFVCWELMRTIGGLSSYHQLFPVNNWPL